MSLDKIRERGRKLREIDQLRQNEGIEEKKRRVLGSKVLLHVSTCPSQNAPLIFFGEN